jgi:hypothetical protein
MPKVDVEGESSKKKGRKRKETKKKKNILNHEHVFGICNKTSHVFKMFRLVKIVGFALWPLLREF